MNPILDPTPIRRATQSRSPPLAVARCKLGTTAKSVSPNAACTLSQSQFEVMVRAYSSDLFRFAYCLCHNRWQSQDLVQETFAAAWKARDSLRDANAAKPWLFSILHNQHVLVLRRRHLEMVDLELDDLPLADAQSGMQRMELEECLGALPENYREPLILHTIDGFSGKEIAAMLKISEPNVMTRLKRARQALRREYCGARPARAGKAVPCGH